LILMKMINDLFALISQYYIFGIIPLDTTLHVVVGFLVTFIGLKMGFRFGRVFIFLLALETIKATHAAMTIDHDWVHGAKEFFATFTYPAWVYTVRKIKAKKYDTASGNKNII